MHSRFESSSIPLRRSNGGRLMESASRLRACDQHAATVLLVDDELKLLEVRRMMLEALGYVVIVAESGENALEILRARPVDAVILDYLMPEMNGETIAREIRALNLATPIILSTGCLSVPSHVLRLVTAVVPKGMAPNHLIEALKQELRRARTGAAH